MSRITDGLLHNAEFIADVKGAESIRTVADRWKVRVGKCSFGFVQKLRAEDGLKSVEGDTERSASDEKLTGRLNLTPDGGEFVDVQTSALITDWSDIFKRFNLDPDIFSVVGDSVRMSNWQQSKRLENGQRDIINLYSYRATFTRKREAIDLPALYVEARQPNPRPIAVQHEPVTTVVAWADLQTGKVDRLGDTKDLLARLDEKRDALTAYLTEALPERIVIADVGDIVEGFNNVVSQIRTNDLSLMEQVDIAATEFWKTIKLCAAFAPVDVLAIPSNHAQWRQGKSLIGKPTDDWGLHISKRLEQLSNEVGLDAAFHRPTDWAETLTFDIRGTILGLAHGHQAGTADRVCQWWEKMTHANIMDCDVLLQGHFHHLRIEPSGRSPRTGKSRWRLQAPTLDNGSTWIRNTAGADSDPGLMVFGVTDDGFDISTLSIL